jgi:hypothetical protein
LLNSKKIVKPTSKGPLEKTPIVDKSYILEKDKPKKVVNDKKKKQPQPNQKKNKSFTSLIKKSEP